MHIALDAMGGDHGSEELIAGALSAVQEAGITVSLVGDESQLHSHLKKLDGNSSNAQSISIVHSSEVVEMNEHPVTAIRKKKDASVVVAFDLVRQGTADAVVSAGNSGATMAAAIRKLGRLDGIARPGIASTFPTLKGPVVLMDIGANVDCKPIHLFQFGVMASAFSKMTGVADPRVGLLTIGEETGKGNSLIKETYPILERSPLNFVGNVEGRDIYQGDIDVIVCDGFVGNICLKVSEGLADVAMRMLREEIKKSWRAKIGYLLSRSAFATFRKRVDYEEYGGAPLLGIDGVGIVCHGKSSSQAIKNAILQLGIWLKANSTRTSQRFWPPVQPKRCGDVMGTIVLGTGSSLPRRVVTNVELESVVDTDDEWIQARTGIVTRRMGGEGEQCYQLATAAARKALDAAGVSPKELGLIVVGTISSHMLMPSTACFVQKELGATNALRLGS